MVTPDDFADDVAPLVRTVDASAYDDLYLVGDVHGCRSELETLFDRLDPTDDDLVVFVGDLVRKGPDSRGVVELVRAHNNFVSVRDNNEDKLVHGRKRLDAVTDPFDDYLAAMPLALLFDDAMVVHGGVDPRRALHEHSADDLLTFRAVPPENGYDGPFWFEQRAEPPRVLRPHRPRRAVRLRVRRRTRHRLRVRRRTHRLRLPRGRVRRRPRRTGVPVPYRPEDRGARPALSVLR